MSSSAKTETMKTQIPKSVNPPEPINSKQKDRAMRKQVFVSYLEGEIDKWTRNSRTLITEQNDLDGAQRNFVRVKAFEDVLEEFNGIYKSEETIKSKQNICYKSDEPCIHDCKGLCRESC